VLAHGLQCGQILAETHPDDPLLAIAGLVHDIADITHPGEHRRHEELGATLVGPLLGTRVAHLVRMHVAAKRYLIATDEEYRSRLSERSVATLVMQGDTLTPGEVHELERDPELAAILALRRADEQAKDPRAEVPGLETWRPRLTSVVAR
jgi:predicted HD phosphohydrolase